MTLQTLTYQQRLLLQRYFDGELQEGTEPYIKASTLINEVVHARQWVDSLEELALSIKGAEQEMWDNAPQRSSDRVVDVALHASNDVSLPELAPMIERMHDEEITEEERLYLKSLLAEQEEAASYLGTLEAMRYSVQSSHDEALEQVDFTGFFDAIEARLDDSQDAVADTTTKPEGEVIQFPGKSQTAERAPFDMEEHQLLLARFFDGEASTEEKAQVTAWAEIDHKVAETLDVFGELSLAMRAATDELSESVEFSGLWSHVEQELAQDFAQGPNVISLEIAREEKALEAKKPAPSRARREFFIAIAAAVLTVFGVGLFSDKLFPSKGTTVVEKTVVIVDSIEYQGGSSGMVMQPASMLNEKEMQTPAIENNLPSKEEETPTIIWILDEDQPEQQPSKKEDKAAPQKTTKSNGQPI